MPDLPSVDKKILPLVVEIEVIRRGGTEAEQKPHKLIMLLAVLDLFNQGVICENKIYLNEQLIRTFEKFFPNTQEKMIGVNQAHRSFT